jgi:hypothetical protein
MKTYRVELEYSELQLLADLLFNINPSRYTDWRDDAGNLITEEYLDNLENKISEMKYL